jgi:hypothetical protein
MHDFALELSHRGQNVKLQLASRIIVRGVDTLRGHDQRHLMRIEFIDDLRKVRKTTPEPIQFETHDHINPSTPDCGHKPVQSLPATLPPEITSLISSTSVQPRRLQYSRRS